jgi:hypothetical protein
MTICGRSDGCDGSANSAGSDRRAEPGPRRNRRGAAAAARWGCEWPLTACVRGDALPDSRGLLAGLLAAPWRGTPVADLVVEVGEARSGTIPGELSQALGDPSLEIGYWLPNLGTYVDVKATLDRGHGLRDRSVAADQVHGPADRGR